jgi:hypothetical protein
MLKRTSICVALAILALGAAVPGNASAQATVTGGQDQPTIIAPGDGTGTSAIRINREERVTLNLLRGGEHVPVAVQIVRAAVGGRLSQVKLETLPGPTLLQLLAGELEVLRGGDETELPEGGYLLIGAGEPVVVSTDDDTAVIRYLSVDPAPN